MINQSLSRFSLCLITASLLTACGSNDDDNYSNIINNNGNNNVSTGAGSTPSGDDSKPNLALSGDNPQRIALGASFINQGATARDVSDGNLTSVITSSNNVNTSVAGCYQQTYLVSDSDGNSNSIMRTVLVGSDEQRHSPNSAPITQEISLTNSYNSISNINLLSSAYDADCDTLTVTQISEPAVGSAQLNNDGTVTFNPLGNVGSHFFIYTVADAYGGSSTSGVTIASVDPDDGNDNWPEVNGENITTQKNTSVLIDVLANDFDRDGDTLILDLVDTPANGTTEKVNGKVLYTPNPGFTGEDSFYYGMHDGHGHNGSGLAVITVTE